MSHLIPADIDCGIWRARSRRLEGIDSLMPAASVSSTMALKSAISCLRAASCLMLDDSSATSCASRACLACARQPAPARRDRSRRGACAARW